MAEVRVRTRSNPAPAAQPPTVRVRSRPAPAQVPAVRVRTRAPVPAKPQRVSGVITTCGLCRQEPNVSGPVIGVTAKVGSQHIVYTYNGTGDITDPANFSSPTRFDDHVAAADFIWRKHNCPTERGATVAPKKRGKAKPAWATGHTTPVRSRARKS